MLSMYHIIRSNGHIYSNVNFALFSLQLFKCTNHSSLLHLWEAGIIRLVLLHFSIKDENRRWRIGDSKLCNTSQIILKKFRRAICCLRKHNHVSHHIRALSHSTQRAAIREYPCDAYRLKEEQQ